MTRPADPSILFSVYFLCLRRGQPSDQGGLSPEGNDQMATMARHWMRHPEYAGFARVFSSPTSSAFESARRFLGELNALNNGLTIDSSLSAIDRACLPPDLVQAFEFPTAALPIVRYNAHDMLERLTGAEQARGMLTAAMLGIAKELADDMLAKAVHTSPYVEMGQTPSDLASVFGRGRRSVLLVGDSPMLELAALEPHNTPRLEPGDGMLYTVTMRAVESGGRWHRRFTLRASEHLSCPPPQRKQA